MHGVTTKTIYFVFDLFNVQYIFFFENLAVYDIMRRNVVGPDRSRMTVGNMRIAYEIPKATNTHSEYVILTAFSLQLCLHELARILRYTYVACLVGIRESR